MWFNQYPYKNLEDFNLDYILNQLRTIKETLTNFINLNTIKYANPIQWNITKQYEANTVVIDANDGTAYLSVKPVPTGVAITNTDYWTPIFTLNLLSANQNITLRDDGVNVLATFASSVGDWLIWNSTLYKVTRVIAVNEAYVVGYNLTRYTVEMFISDYIGNVTNYIDGLTGDMADLTTTDKTSLVNAINEIVNAVNTIVSNVGDLSDLTTTDKTSVVNSINELVTNINNISSSLISNSLLYPDMFTGTDSQKLQSCMDALQTNGGTIVINRDMELTTDVIIGLPSDDVQNYITVIGIGKNSTITMNGAKFIGAPDADIRHCGQVKFINLKFKGADNTTDILIVTDYVLRCGFIHCTFSDFLNVFTTPSVIMQSYVIEDCVFLKTIVRAFSITGTGRWFDVRIHNCRAESITEFIDFNTDNYHTRCAYGVDISDCCVESCRTRYAIRLHNSSNVTIKNNYFEDNLVSIKLDEAYESQGIIIENNQFIENVTVGNIAIQLPTHTTGALGSIDNNVFIAGTTGNYFFNGNPTGTLIIDNFNNTGATYSTVNIVKYLTSTNGVKYITPTSVTITTPNTPKLVGNIRTLVDSLGTNKTVVGIALGAVSASDTSFDGHLILSGDNLYAVFSKAQTYTFRFTTFAI